MYARPEQQEATNLGDTEQTCNVRSFNVSASGVSAVSVNGRTDGGGDGAVGAHDALHVVRDVHVGGAREAVRKERRLERHDGRRGRERRAHLFAHA